MMRQRPDGSFPKPLYDMDALLRLGSAGLAFAVVWASLIGDWPMTGIVFGWVPALFAAVSGFCAMDLLLGFLNQRSAG